MKKNISKQPFLNKKDEELKKLMKIADEMGKINNSITRTKEDEQRFEELIDQILKLNPKFKNQYITLFKFCIAYMDNYYLRKNNSIIENHLKSLEEILEIRSKSSIEFSDLRKQLLKQYDETISSLNYSNYLFNKRNELMDIVYKAKVYYPPFKKEFDMIHNQKIRSKEAIEFAFSLLDEIKTKKSSFLMLIYQNRNDSKFLRVFPKLMPFDFTKLNGRYENTEFISVLEEYFIRFTDSFKPSRKTPKKKNHQSKK
ncbi:MAG: hypothetical protein JSS91_02815 [Bacteroidetes bacterium]|nr:hypothetical protein [Bacteroidota bacterium]